MANRQKIGSEQIRTARTLLKWSQQDLAKKAGIGPSTVADFERDSRTPILSSIQAMRTALETAGVRFLPNGSVIRASQITSPIGVMTHRWVYATDLIGWAGSTEARNKMPELLNLLIRAQLGKAADLLFRSDESVQQPGWDGICVTEQGDKYIPAGNSYWEISTQAKTKDKVDSDYGKRTKKPLGANPSNSTFIFVTPRCWPGKDKWVQKQNRKGIWKEIRVYDGDDLVQWLEMCPAVSIWLLKIMGKLPPQGFRLLNETWEEWSNAASPPITTKLVLAGRDKEKEQTQKWLEEKTPSVHAVQGESSDEAIAFLYAVIRQLQPDHQKVHISRCLVTTDDAARKLKESRPLIFVLDDAEFGLAQMLASRGHHVYVAYGSDVGIPVNVLQLTRPPRDELQSALVEMGVKEEAAIQLTSDSARSVSVIRRLMQIGPVRIPKWATEPQKIGLITALLVGSWNDRYEGDKEILESIAGCKYETILSDLTPLLTNLDGPIRRIGNTWKIASRRDSWALLARYVTQEKFNLFEQAAIKVFTHTNPIFNMKTEERWMAHAKGVYPHYSELLLGGIAETLALISVFGKQATGLTNPNKKIQYIVGEVLKEADEKRWWSLSEVIQFFSEAAPDVFLSKVDESLNKRNRPIMVLFKEDNGLAGRYYGSELLWALERLAWEKNYLGYVALVLAKLASQDPGGSYQNRPKNSLRSIFCLLSPQTHATLEERIIVIDNLRQKNPDEAWDLMIATIPSRHDIIEPSPQPRWRSASQAQDDEPITESLIQNGKEKLIKRLMEDVGFVVKRWRDLIKILPNLTPSSRDKVLSQLSKSASYMSDDEARLNILDALRALSHKHRKFVSAPWVLPISELDLLDKACSKLEPKNNVKRFAWLFKSWVELPHPTNEGMDADQRELKKLRCKAVKEVLTKGSVNSIFELANCVEQPRFVGEAAASLSDAALNDKIMLMAITGSNQSDKQLATGMLDALYKNRGNSWMKGLLKRVTKLKIGNEATTLIFTSLPASKTVWTQVALAGKTIEDSYWKQVPVYQINRSEKDIKLVIEKLMGARRAREAIQFVCNKTAKLPSELIVKLLRESATEPLTANSNNDLVTFQYYVTEALKILDKDKRIQIEIIGSLEWTYLPLLEHSERPPSALEKLLSRDSAFFVKVLSTAFPPENEGEHKTEKKIDSRQAIAAFSLLRSWSLLPGTKEDGSICEVELQKWIRGTRELCTKVDRSTFGDQQIGQMLAASPPSVDGTWPIAAVRNAIENIQSSELEHGFILGVMNRRGVTSRAMTDGGEQERQKEKQYLQYAEKIQLDYPKTASVLRDIAKRYNDDGEWWDEHVENIILP